MTQELTKEITNEFMKDLAVIPDEFVMEFKTAVKNVVNLFVSRKHKASDSLVSDKNSIEQQYNYVNMLMADSCKDLYALRVSNADYYSNPANYDTEERGKSDAGYSMSDYLRLRAEYADVFRDPQEAYELDHLYDNIRDKSSYIN